MKLIMENWRKYTEQVELEEAGGAPSFSAKNFPAEGNEKFAGAGERTQHSQKPESFPTLAPTSLKVGDEAVPVPEGTAVQFLKPWKLYYGVDLGISGRAKKSVFAAASVEGVGEGYINIRAVAKPSGGGQSRVSAGSGAQDEIMGVISLKAEKEGTTVEKISSAPPGSTKPDLVVNYGGNKIQFEVKGRNSTGGFITVFDKSVRRGKPSPPIVDAVIHAYLEALSVEYEDEGKVVSATLGAAMKREGYALGFEGAMDFYNKTVDSSIGFCGDSGVPKSGKLPRAFVTKDPSVLAKMRDYILEHLRESGDDYFDVYTRSSETADVYSTGGTNLLKAIEVPAFKAAGLMTYGGCSGGATRVGFKVQLAPQDSNLPDPPKES